MIQRQKLRQPVLVALRVAITFALLFPASGLLYAQSVATLSQVKKIYIEPFSGKRGAGEIRTEVVDRLKRNPTLTLVSSPSQADAVLKGTGEIWVSGYIGTNPRAQSSNRNPIYSGYLSLTLVGGNSQPLWSYLITPAGALSGAITYNLADHGVRLLLTAVKHDGAGGASPAAPGVSSAPAQSDGLQGAGATFPAPLYQAWIQSFRQIHPEIHITYDAIGSEAGVQRLIEKKIDFAASDAATLPEGGALQRFATVLGAVVPIYNLRGLDRGLRFTPEVLAQIYLGKITHWDAPEILAVNRGVSLPHVPIVVVHRSDGSGTTYAFTDFLSKANSAWKEAIGAGTTAAWPVGSGAAGNGGVAALVGQTANSIGYVELTYAIQHELSFGAVRNSSGAYITANLESLEAAAQSAVTGSTGTPSITDAPGKASYPIASFSWIVLPKQVPSAQRSAVAQMLQWMLTSGQKQSAALGYAPLPRELASRELQSLAQLQ